MGQFVTPSKEIDAVLNTNNAFEADSNDWDLTDDYVMTFTCEIHGTKTMSDMAIPERDCCDDASSAQLRWDCFIETLAGCAWQDRSNYEHFLAGTWIGDYAPATEAGLLEWAAARQAEDDAEFDYGFNVLAKQMREEVNW
jgi:hypothetical protein